MKSRSVPYSTIPQFSKFDVDFSSGNVDFKEFNPYSSDLSSILRSTEDRSLFPVERQVLVEVLKDQYSKIGADASGRELIDRLNEPNTFTITTAHQPCLFTGPLYTIYKIISIIKLARQASESFSAYQYIPVFVVGGEDHDFEEMNHVHLFHQKLNWKTEQDGAVGRFNPQSLADVISELSELFKNDPQSQAIVDLLTASISQVDDYASAFQKLLYKLFNQYGLLIINMDDRRLKDLFKDEFIREALDFDALNTIAPVQQRIIDKGYKAATYLREVNFFYFHEGHRNRIEFGDGNYQVVDTNLVFSPDEIVEEINKHPERFSPNVNLRPLYQEKLLPNVAYVGGGGEIAYWLERWDHFRSNKIHYPALFRRDSVIWVDKPTVNKLNKLGLTVEDLFEGVDAAISKYLADNSDTAYDFEGALSQGDSIFKELTSYAIEVDPTLKGAFEAEHVKFQKSIEHMAAKLVRAQKSRHETALNQIRNIYSKLFPEGGLQERHDNFLPYWLKMGDDYLSVLLLELDPLRKEVKMILEEG